MNYDDPYTRVHQLAHTKQATNFIKNISHHPLALFSHKQNEPRMLLANSSKNPNTTPEPS